jgi:putative membrane protein
MLATALIFAGLAALVHVYIFVLESLRWTAPATRRTFGISEAEALATRELAFNQGFYNLFLAAVTAAGMISAGAGHQGVAAALVLAGCGSMLAAGLVLLISSPKKAKAALVQLTFPLLAVVFLLVWLILTR